MSYYGSHPFGSWTTKLPVFGQGLGERDPIQTATTIIHGVWLFSFVALAIGAVFAGNKARRYGQTLYSACLVLCLAIIYYAFAFAYNIIEDHGAEITPAYLLVNIILGQDLHYLVDICLLIAVVNLFYHIFQQTGSKNSPSKKGILWAHYFICIVLTALYLATTGLDIRGLWYQIFDPEGIKSQFFSGGRPRILYVYILDITFNAIYLSASLEILGGAFWIFTTRRQRDISNSTASILLTLVALPLLVRSAFTLGEKTTFEIPQTVLGLLNPEALYIIQTILYGLGLLLVLIGVILISIRQSPLSDSRSVRSFDIENMHGTPEGSSNTTNDRDPLEAHSSRYSAHPAITPEESLRSDLYRGGKMSRMRKCHWPSRRIGAGGGGLGMLTF